MSIHHDLQAAGGGGSMAEGHQGPPPPVPDLTEEDLRILELSGLVGIGVIGSLLVAMMEAIIVTFATLLP